MRWQIADNLFQADLAGEGGDISVGCSPASALLPMDKSSLRVLFPFEDGPHLPNLVMLHQVANFIVAAVGSGRSVVVNCDAGCNRSGLVIGVALWYLGNTDPVATIKANHPAALSNETFAQYLRNLADALV